MVNIYRIQGENFVEEIDYLKVVKEKEVLKRKNKTLEQNLISKTDQYNGEKENLKLREELSKIKEWEELYKIQVNTLKEKDEEIENLKNKIHFCKIDKLTKFMSENYPEFAGLQVSDVVVTILKNQSEEIVRLKNLYEPEKQYEEWCELKYWYEDVKTGTTKMFRQHMNYEEACELIGMDSDNWNEFNVVKYKKEVK